MEFDSIQLVPVHSWRRQHRGREKGRIREGWGEWSTFETLAMKTKTQLQTKQKQSFTLSMLRSWTNIIISVQEKL